MSSLSKCYVCTDPETSDNRIFGCCECEIGVHELCYGIDDDCMFAWLCSPCTMNKYEVFCELCQQKGGALKQTTCGKWAHVICALFTVGVEFQNKILMEPVNISKIPATNRNKTCIFWYKTCGTCCKCNQLHCDEWMHVTCAQKANCLKEVVTKKDKIAFQAFCIGHKPVDDASRRLSSACAQGRLSEEGAHHHDEVSSNDDVSPNDANELNDTPDAIKAIDSNDVSDTFDISNEASFSSRTPKDNNNSNIVSDTAAATNEIDVASEASAEASNESFIDAVVVADASDQQAVEIDMSKIDQPTSSQRNF